MTMWCAMRKLKLAFLLAARSFGLFRLARQLTRHKLRILCYHGFELESEAQFRPKLFISRAAFARRLATIRKAGYNVLPLRQAVERLYHGSLPLDPVVITIDDGFHSVISVALPLLKRYGLPATVYVTSYYVQRNHPVFRLVVQYMFWKTDRDHLELRNLLPGREQTIDLTIKEQAQSAMAAIIEHGETDCSEDQRRALSVRLGDALGVSYAKIEDSRILTLMSPQEIAEIALGNIDIQLHTHRHRFPSDRQVARREIMQNRLYLEQLVGGEKNHFCYPSGKWDSRQWPWLDELGIKSSTTCLSGLNDRHTPRHGLKRFLDGGDIHQLEFEAGLSGFSELVSRFRNLGDGNLAS
jgi:peptidoglycan/xylan/chitin deacetylase (PgdA/CDA1 family)